MKNLKLFAEISADLELQADGEEVLLLAAFDIERARAFFASSANFIYTLPLPLSRGSSPEAEPLPLDPGDRIAAMDYLMEKEALVVGTADGCLLLHTVDAKATEVVGKVEGGVKSIACSPDGALLAITTGSGQLLVMTPEWDLQYESPLDPQLSEGMELSDMDGFSCCQFESSISWRGDGKYFATLVRLDDHTSLQKLRIWDRDSGILHSSSESKAFMGTCLDWMPSGAKVAAVYDRKEVTKSPDMVFFEKNGLERSSFTIDATVEATVEILKWNCSSDVLAALVICDQYDSIKIWSFSNNHWYLKQDIRYSKEDGVKFMWDPIRPLHLICWTLHGKIITYNFIWSTAVTDTSVATVIDNSNILVTPLSSSLVPPPMSLFDLKFHSPVQDITFFSKSSKNYVAASLSDHSLCAVEFPGTDFLDQLEGKSFDVESCRTDLTLGTLMHLTLLDSHILLGVSRYTPERGSMLPRTSSLTYQQKVDTYNSQSLLEIEFVCSEDSAPGSVCSSGWHAKILRRSPLEQLVIGIVPNPAKKGSAFIQMSGGSIYEYSSSLSNVSTTTRSGLYELKSEHGFESSCPWIRAVLVGDSGELRPLIFGLDENGRLHHSRKILWNSCSSFSFYASSGVSEQTSTHMILSTKQDILLIISMNDVLHGMPEEKINSHITKGRKEENKDYVQIWERGAKIIGVVHGDEAAVILQTTRGNLECIYPRKLVLVSIINALIQRRFQDAMLMVRRHRIDLNVLVDYCGWKTFLKSAKEFVTKVNNLGHITEFISSIKNENVFDTLYKPYVTLPSVVESSYEGSEYFQKFGENKISSVLFAVRKALEENIQESAARELCILTTLARSEPPALEEALKRIKVTRELELLGVDDARRKSYPSAEESLKHLLWLTDPDAVFDTALGLYDLNLAAIVALNSQKDPKEFIPYLKGLEQLSPAIMKYTIDLKLLRYESALRNVVSAGINYYEDCMNLLKNNPELFPLGLQLFSDRNKRSQILEAWGDHLSSEKHFEDAAAAYLCCSSFQKALSAYRACADWKGVLRVAGLLELSKEEVQVLASDLCEELQALGKPAEAAKVAIEYCADVSKGVDYFIIAREWEEALRFSFMQGHDLVSIVNDAALECAASLMSEYTEGIEKVGKYLARYLAVRQRRLLLAAKIQSEERSINDFDYDTLSESSSLSGMSAYTTRTGKVSGASVSSSSASKVRDTRRQKHRGGRIRAGSPGEEMALVEHLKGMSLSSGAQSELKSLIVTLIMLGKNEIALKLQSATDTFQLSQEAAVKLAEDTIENDIIDENSQTLDHYIRKLKALPHKARPWQSKVLLA